MSKAYNSCLVGPTLQERSSLLACMARNPDTLWILKPPNMNNGTGIQVKGL